MTGPSVKLAHDSSSAPRTLLLRLKDETRDVHESLERDLNLLRTNLSLEEYRSVVERFYGFYCPWERLVDPLLTRHLPGFAAERAKTPRLLQDLAQLGVKADGVKLCAKLPDCVTWPAVLGCLYVTEGATLGGQIISRRLEQQLGLSPRSGTAFFWSYGLEVGRMWRSFCAMLTAHTKPGQEAMVVSAARQTFDVLHTWLCGGT